MPESGVAAAAVEPAAEAVAVEEEMLGARGKNGGKGRKRLSLLVSGRGRR